MITLKDLTRKRLSNNLIGYFLNGKHFMYIKKEIDDRYPEEAADANIYFKEDGKPEFGGFVVFPLFWEFIKNTESAKESLQRCISKYVQRKHVSKFDIIR